MRRGNCAGSEDSDSGGTCSRAIDFNAPRVRVGIKASMRDKSSFGNGASTGASGICGGACPAQHSPRYNLRCRPRRSIWIAAVPSGKFDPHPPQRSRCRRKIHLLKTAGLYRAFLVHDCSVRWRTRDESADHAFAGRPSQRHDQASRERPCAQSQYADGNSSGMSRLGMAVCADNHP